MATVKFIDERKGKFGDSPDTGTAELHHLPFQIEYNGAANVKKRLGSSIQVNPETKELEMEFRARPLKGCKLNLPQEYTGLVMESTSPLVHRSKLETDSKDQTLFIKKDFTEFVYWNWDKVTTRADTQVKMMDWLELASSIHIPESVHDVENNNK